jgi:hypothetical protein
MACTIVVTGVTGVTIAGKLDHIFVFGTATDCDLVEVTIECTMRKTVEAKVQGGAWVASFPAAETGCACGSIITVSAECVSGQCRVPPTKYTLLCQEQTNNCPQVFDKPLEISDCNKDGTRTVSFFYQFILQGMPVGATLLVDGVVEGSVPVMPPPAATYVLTYSTNLLPGPHSVAYVFDPSACASHTTNFVVPPCPPPGDCPKITFEEPRFESDCRDGSRSVRVTATVEPQGAPVDAKLVGAGGTVLDAPPPGQIAKFPLSGVQNLPNGTTTISVVVTAPPGCPGRSQQVQVDCPPPPKPTGGPSGGGSDDGDGDGGGCFFGRVLIVMLFATALFLLIIGICLAMPYLLIAAAVAAVVAGIAFALWWAFCGSKCAALLLTWQVAAIGAVVAAFLILCCPWVIFVAIGLGLAALAGFYGWIKVCHPSACKVLFELLWLFVTPVPFILKPLSTLAPCGTPGVPVWVGLAAGALAIAWGVAGCAKKA